MNSRYLLLSTLLLAGCSTPGVVPTGGGAGAAVSGTVAYRERIALPPTAVIKVQLVDVSRADAPAVVVGEQLIEAGGRQVPFAFKIPYDPARIDQHYAVITRGAPIDVAMMLRSVGGR